MDSNMNEKSGLTLLCDNHGVIIDILNNPPELGIEVQPGMLFARLAANGSVSKALSFLVDTREQRIALDQGINVAASGTCKTFHFAGSTVGEDILIVGAEDGSVAQELHGEMMRISNEQTSSLRTLLKEQKQHDGLYDEISHLNNNLVAAQRELAKRNAELGRLNQEKNRFLGMAAHELRNPLHTILGYSEFLMEDDVASDERQEFLKIISDMSRYMAHIVDDLLDIAKIEAGELNLECQPISLGELITQNIARNRSLAARKQLEVVCELAEEVRPVTVDSAKIEQVLNNLISNAIKFSTAGKKIVIRLALAGENCLISVSDEGCGIPLDKQPHLFEPFKKGQAGTAGEKSIGLGLVVVKRIVEGHGGRIWFESQVGRGTTFFVSLPLCCQPPARTERANGYRKTHPTGRRDPVQSSW
jgi:signal transduction histidine kinase